MRSTQTENSGNVSPQSSSGKTSLGCLPPKTTLLGSSLELYPEHVWLYSRQVKNGKTLVMCLDQPDESLGEFSPLNTSECPNDAVESILSQVLETGLIPPKYYLSAKAARGILRRAKTRKRKLPPLLQAALERVAQTITKPKQGT